MAKITQEAAEQSQRNVLPDVTLLASIQELLATFSQFDHILIAYEESAKQDETATLARLLQKIQPNSRVLAIFGPEGGFSKQEIESFTQKQALLCGLGSRILRAETAPLYLLSAISYHVELLKQ